MAARGQGRSYQGAKWIRREKRLAIYLRDGLACAYCGATIEDGAVLTLDHLECHHDGGSNDARNLVTACRKCNSSRADRPIEHFVAAVAGYLDHGIAAADILSHVDDCTARPLDVPAARALIERRGSYAAALSS